MVATTAVRLSNDPITPARQEGVPLQVKTSVVDADQKRLHVHHHMLRQDTGDTVASTELLLMFVDTAAGRSAEFPAPVAAAVAEFRQRWEGLPEEGEIGRRIAIRRAG